MSNNESVEIRISQLRALDALSREKSFSAAAEALKVSQPAISLQLRNLQQKHGVKLFMRKGKSIEFTQFGQGLVLKARKILSLLKDMENSIQAVSELQSGHLAIGLSCHYLVMELLAAFMERYSGVQVDAYIKDSVTLIDEVINCKLDIALVTGSQPDPRLHNTLYSQQQIILFVSRDHPWANQDRLHFKELHGQRMVARHRSSMTRQIFESKVKGEGIKPRIVLELDSWASLKEAVAAGIGFGIALEDEFSEDPRLVKLELEGADFQAYQYFVCLPEYLNLRPVNAFLELATRFQTDQKAS